MVISSFIIYASLETAGNYSALLRVVDVSVDRSQEIDFVKNGCHYFDEIRFFTFHSM